MAVLLHAGSRTGIEEARRWAARLSEVLGSPVETRSAGPRAREAAARGEGPPDAWSLLGGPEMLRATAASRERLVVLPRRDPRWSLEDMAKRPLDRLPPGSRVLAPPGLGEALLRRARPDLVPLKAGGFPAPEETPVLAEGPYDGRPAGDPLDLAPFPPAPGTGLAGLAAPAGGEPGAAARSLEDAPSRATLEIEAAFAQGVGELPPGSALGAHARRKVEALYGLRAVLFLPGEAPRDFSAEIPTADRIQFARAFGRHVRGE